MASEGDLTDLFADADREAANASQEDVQDEGGIFDGVTKVEQLAQVTSGTFHYKDINTTLAGGSGGTYNFDLDIDFGSRTIGGGSATNKIVTSQAGHTATYILGTKSFDLAEDLARQPDVVGGVDEHFQIHQGTQSRVFENQDTFDQDCRP